MPLIGELRLITFGRWELRSTAFNVMETRIPLISIRYEVTQIFLFKFHKKSIAARTLGAYIELQNFNIVKDMILSICFREASPELMHVYEKEIIAEGRMTHAMHTMIRQVSKEIPRRGEKEEEIVPEPEVCIFIFKKQFLV